MSILRSHRVIGIVFLALIAASLWFTYAVFSQKFTSFDEVTLKSSSIGLQMPQRADVKYRGVIVGQVLDFKPVDGGAELTLGIEPDQMKTIPSDVTGSILPKTLFGEKYVSLDAAAGDTSSPLKPHDVIARTKVATEVEEVLSDLLPLLRAVQPEQLNYTLNALATALEGRGPKLGQGLTNLDNYLKRFNPEVDDFITDIRKTAQVSDLYADVMPQIATILRNTVYTGNTLKTREAKLQKLFGEVSAFSDTARSFLAANEKNIIRLGQLSQVQLRLLAKYAPQYPCFLKGMELQNSQIQDMFRGHMLHINAELIPHQPRGWTPADKPVNGLVGSPYCGPLPRDTTDQSHMMPAPPNFDDGVDTPTGKGTMRVAPATDGDAYSGTSAEAALLRSLLSPVVGTDAADVPDLAVFLLAPMARGSEVSVQ
ncbi:MCE family protein [Nocardioides jiangxiensis]|uniref:MCE family protein n=1 Tax=Nocardioides jiangxiensis TaxID=3064524 RepID=A0ABT9B0G2_9ACTN|nr:MCE family protein [Nocardioides sp. WY-20]MDO7867733.1 MCE family protein [Nocardioides sp. WY-20]